MAFEIAWEPRGVCKRFFGYVTDEELLQGLIKVESDHRFDTLRFVINDFLGVEGFAVTEDSVSLLAAIDKAAALSNPNIVIAVVATDAQVQALARLYAGSPMNVYPTEIFPGVAEARSWISAGLASHGWSRPVGAAR